MVEYEFWNLAVPREQSRHAVCRMLTNAAEYHGWELDLKVQLAAGHSTRARRA